MSEQVLITGGAGFVGSNLAIALKRWKPQIVVTALDNLKRRGSEANLERLGEAGVRFVHGDIRSLSDLTRLEPPDLIVECSAEPSAQAGYGGSPEYLIQTNLIGCFHCLELARRAKSDVIFISTSRVYPFQLLNSLPYFEEETRYTLTREQCISGASEHGVSENFPLDGPRSLYGMTKLSAELMVEEYADAYGLRVIIDRFGLTTGPWQMGNSDQGVISQWMAAHYFNRPLSYIGFGGTGKQVRDFLHIDDFCDLLLDQIDHFSTYQGRRFNVGGGNADSLSLLETTDLCQQITGRRMPISSSPENRPADVRIYITDHRQVSLVNGWHPRRDAWTTLVSIFEWLRKEESRVKPILTG